MTANIIPAEARYVDGDREYVRVKLISQGVTHHHTEGFGLYDAKGREMGYMYVIWREVHEVAADSHTLCRAENAEARLGETFVVCPQATRDGDAFGAIPVSAEKRFRTFAEAQAHAEKAVRRAEKRAIKAAAS